MGRQMAQRALFIFQASSREKPRLQGAARCYSDGLGGMESRWRWTSAAQEVSGYFLIMIRASSWASLNRPIWAKDLATLHSNSGALGLLGNRASASLANCSDKGGSDAAYS